METLKLRPASLHVALTVALFIFLLGCNKDTAIQEEPIVTTSTLKVSDFSKLGEIHNAFLSNVNDNFNAVKKEESLDERIEVLNNFNKEFAKTLNLSEHQKQFLIDGLENHKDLVVTENLARKSLRLGANTTAEDSEESAFVLIEGLKSAEQISEGSYSILNRLVLDLKSNYEHSLSDAQLKLNIKKLVKEFDNLNFTDDSQEGQMIASILAISIASIEWWKENPKAFAENAKTMALPVWAAADVVGGVIGAGASALIQYKVNGEINGEIVAYSAVGGAVVGSTGIVGKAAKWLSSLF